MGGLLAWGVVSVASKTGVRVHFPTAKLASRLAIPVNTMPRRARLDLPDIPQHIIQRGNDRQPCFFAQADYTRYRNSLRESALDVGCVVHAYVLMTNHVHLLATPTETGGVARMMQALGRRYVRYVNDTYHRTKKGENISQTNHQASARFKRKCSLTPFFAGAIGSVGIAKKPPEGGLLRAGRTGHQSLHAMATAGNCP